MPSREVERRASAARKAVRHYELDPEFALAWAVWGEWVPSAQEVDRLVKLRERLEKVRDSRRRAPSPRRSVSSSTR
jgi:hypothetical protein